jgi:hypothetical protein
MHDASKVAATLSVTFAIGVVTGWLLNSYTRKVRERERQEHKTRDSPNPDIAAFPLADTQQGLEGMLNKLQSKVKRI